MAAAPFSEPREWDECSLCSTWIGRETFTACPECGQPPRCRAGSSVGNRCSRPATVRLFAEGPISFCGQHRTDQDLMFEQDEWECAESFVRTFRETASKIGNEALVQAMDLAFSECQMQAYMLREQRREIWKT